MKTIITTLLVIISMNIHSQKTNINPKGKWFFGAEIGSNRIASYSSGEAKTLQGGILAEYYFARHWSFSGKIKYFDTGVSFFIPSTPGTGGYFLSFEGRPEYSGTFNGSVITVPVAIKWEFRVCQNLGANLKLGFVYNFEAKSEYTNYSENLKKVYPDSYEGSNAGFGFNYFVNKKTAIYIDVESFDGASKGTIGGFFGPITYTTQNVLMSIGFKYCFKKS